MRPSSDRLRAKVRWSAAARARATASSRSWCASAGRFSRRAWAASVKSLSIVSAILDAEYHCGANLVNPKRMTIVTTTERLILRRWRESDREAFARMNADPRVMEFLPALLSREESDRMVDRIEKHFDEHGFGLCAVEWREDGSFVGFVGLWVPSFQARFTPCVEIGWRLAEEFWGKGVATEGARAIVQYAFEDLGISELVSFTVPGNLRSRRVMEKIGMVRDPGEDFDHPNLAEGHGLRRHVLYRVGRGG
jgi:RimJ/RimL family protein N-acetyltransferase